MKHRRPTQHWRRYRSGRWILINRGIRYKKIQQRQLFFTYDFQELNRLRKLMGGDLKSEDVYQHAVIKPKNIPLNNLPSIARIELNFMRSGLGRDSFDPIDGYLIEGESVYIPKKAKVKRPLEIRLVPTPEEIRMEIDYTGETKKPIYALWEEGKYTFQHPVLKEKYNSQVDIL